MRYLLDSHTFLWYASDAPELSAKAKALILDDSIEIVISMVSFWEISIKNSLGKLRLETDFKALLDVAQMNRFEIISINFDHTVMLNTLPFHHRDPFDRMLIAQAMYEDMNIIGIDEMFDNYLIDKDIKRIW